MSRFESAIEAQIKAARRRGDFDNLPGAGKPIEGLDRDDPDWWLKNKMKEEGLEGGVVVPSLQLRADVPRELARIRLMKDRDTARTALAALNLRIHKVNSRQIRGPSSNVAPIDINAFLQQM